MSRDNISGAKGNNFIVVVFLIPGKVMQFFIYMNVRLQQVYGKVRKQTKMTRFTILFFF